MQGTVKGGRRQGRQRKRWEDHIREWSGLEFGRSQRAVKNREKWRKLVAKSSVVPRESWTLTAELQRRIQAMEMRCYRKILHISYKDHVTNEEAVPRFNRQLDHTKIS